MPASRTVEKTIRVRGRALPWGADCRPPIVLRQIRRHGCQVWQVAAPAGVMLNVACDPVDPQLRVTDDCRVCTDDDLRADWKNAADGKELRAALCRLIDGLVGSAVDCGFGPAASYLADTVGAAPTWWAA